MTDYSKDPIPALVTELSTLIELRPGRPAHYLPDLALKMLATQVLQYSRAFLHLSEGRLVSWSFPIARTAFETAEDLAHLAFAPTVAEYDRRGALAHVGAEIAISKSNGLAQAAVPQTPIRRPKPERHRIDVLASEWARFRPEGRDIVESAYKEARSAWTGGRKAWTLLSRADTHSTLEAQLGDSDLGRILRSWYDALASRTHPGLHSPQLDRHETGHAFIIDGDEQNGIPQASIRFALTLAIDSLRHQYESWDSGLSAA